MRQFAVKTITIKMINMLFNQSQEPVFQENANVILNGGVK